MNDGQSDAQLLKQWRDGDADAARLLFERYSHRLTALASRNLNQRLSQRVDGDDVVQSVFRTFFRRTSGGEYQIDSSSDIWKLLVQITIFKTRSQARRHTTDGRDVDVEVCGEFVDRELLSREPNPEEAALLVDEIEILLKGLPDKSGEILAQRLEGRAKTEIAENLGVSRQTVHRLLGLLQDRLRYILHAQD